MNDNINIKLDIFKDKKQCFPIHADNAFKYTEEFLKYFINKGYRFNIGDLIHIHEKDWDVEIIEEKLFLRESLITVWEVIFEPKYINSEMYPDQPYTIRINALLK